MVELPTPDLLDNQNGGDSVEVMSRRRKIAIGGVALLLLVAFAFFLNSRLSAGGIPAGGWHYDQLLVYTKMSKTNQNTNPVLRDLYIFDTASNTEKKLPGISTGAVGRIAYSPATKILAYSNFKLKSDNTQNYNSCTLEIYDMSKFKKLPNLGSTINEPSGCSAPFSWSPDGSIMIFKHIIDYDYGNLITKYAVLNNSLLNKRQITIKKVGILTPDGYQDIKVDQAFGWYDPKAFVASINQSPLLTKVTFPAPRYIPVVKPISGTSNSTGKIVFDNSFKKDLLYSIRRGSLFLLGDQVATVPFAGGTQTVLSNTKYAKDYILMKYGVDQSGGKIKGLVYRQYKGLTDLDNGYYAIDPNSGVKTFIDGTNLYGSIETEFLSFDSGPNKQFYFRRIDFTSQVTGYFKVTIGDTGSSLNSVVSGLSRTEL